MSTIRCMNGDLVLEVLVTLEVALSQVRLTEVEEESLVWGLVFDLVSQSKIAVKAAVKLVVRTEMRAKGESVGAKAQITAKRADAANMATTDPHLTRSSKSAPR